jgi:hypothetical protein
MAAGITSKMGASLVNTFPVGLSTKKARMIERSERKDLKDKNKRRCMKIFCFYSTDPLTLYRDVLDRLQ